MESQSCCNVLPSPTSWRCDQVYRFRLDRSQPMAIARSASPVAPGVLTLREIQHPGTNSITRRSLGTLPPCRSSACDEAGMSLHWPLPRLRHVSVRKRSPHICAGTAHPPGLQGGHRPVQGRAMRSRASCVGLDTIGIVREVTTWMQSHSSALPDIRPAPISCSSCLHELLAAPQGL